MADGWNLDPFIAGLTVLPGRFGDRSWCPTCSREVVPFDGACVGCGTPVEELGTGDDDPYPEDAS